VTPGGKLSTFASGFSNPQDLIFDASGNLFVANMGNGTVSEVTSDGKVSTFIGGGLNSPRGLAHDSPSIVTLAPSNGIMVLSLGLCGLVGFAWRLKSGKKDTWAEQNRTSYK
jgi:hypothetical protein